MPRDKVLLYLWPESNTRRARNSLHQTLYAIRRHLGQESVVAGIPNLQLNPRFFSCDLWDFEAAIGRGAHQEAVALYTGHFLEGFALPDLPELEHWAEEQRDQLRRRYAEALEAAAAQAARQGHHRLAIERWQALTALEPLSSRPALGLMRAFVAAGNRASALEHAREYATLIQRELGTTPDPAVIELMDQLRSRRSSGSLAQPAEPDTAEEFLPAPRESATELPPTSPPETKLRRLRTVILALLVVEILIAVGLWWTQREPRRPMSPDLVAVLPFTVVGNANLQYLDTGLVDLLTTNLEGAGALRSVDPRALLGWLGQSRSPIRTPREAERVAARFGAGLFLLGTVVESGGLIHLRASLYDWSRDDDPVASAAQQGRASELFEMVDRLTAELLATGPHGPRERLARVAAATTGSIDALKSYLAGERELRAGDYVRALDSYQLAVGLDTAFALAHYRLSIAAEWLGQDSLSREAAAAANRFGARLSEHDRLLVEALAARRRGRAADAERLYRQVVDHYPDDVEAWFQLGQVLFHANPLRGRSSTEARGAFERVLALDPENEEALVHLARIGFIEGRRREVDTLVERVLALASSKEVLELRAFRAFALGDPEAHKRVTRELLESPPDVPPVTALQAAVFLDDIEGVDRFGQLLRNERYSAQVRGLGYRVLARVGAARGRWADTRAQLDTAARFDATAALELRSLLAVLPFLEVPRADLVAVQAELEAWRPANERAGETAHSSAHAGLHPYVRLYRLGLVCAELGDTAAARRHADALDRSTRGMDSLTAEALHTFSRSVRSRVAVAAGQPAVALALLDESNWELVEPAFESEALHRYYRAELLRGLGRDGEALNWYRTIAQRATYEVVYVAPARLREAEIHRVMGDRLRAARAFEAAARLWKDADPGPRKALNMTRTAIQ